MVPFNLVAAGSNMPKTGGSITPEGDNLAPGLARGGQVSDQLADVGELLVDGDLWVAPVLSEVRGIVAQDGRYGRRTALDRLPRRKLRAHDLIDAPQSAKRRACVPEIA